MKQVYKYLFAVTDVFSVRMPKGAKILAVQTQNDSPCIWALVDLEAETVRRHLRLAGTGHSLPDDPGTFIGTFQMHGGAVVFHLFDQGESP